MREEQWGESYLLGPKKGFGKTSGPKKGRTLKINDNDNSCT